MIHALDRKKTNLQSNYCEDTQVASTIGILKNLPAELFWQILRKSCKENFALPSSSGEILNIEFWPGGWKYINRVEPDVYIEFEKFDLIIEAKVSDKSGQLMGQEQWRKEVIAYLLNKDLQNIDRPLHFIALGGNEQMNSEFMTITQNDLIEVNDRTEKDFKFDVQVFKSNWFTLLNVISDIHKQFSQQEYFQVNKMTVLRIIEDAIIGFNLHDMYAMDWFDSFTYEANFNEKTINNILNWKYEN
ncbi:hypothetical protein [Myroides profundi]|uniref:Restriction endonuclease n=1 Tax=Myroides profundi TaxID=480520 RepID=A0AAJ4W448_MYRPR|nr:hypothetical protein [Myroides profundi]AJH14535.1 hypothetical protein MPR_1353 [Myroides profundi]SEQ93446.1 hypothetical protein SAMN04488089_107155 [Myroides profundi]